MRRLATHLAPKHSTGARPASGRTTPRSWACRPPTRARWRSPSGWSPLVRRGPRLAAGPVPFPLALRPKRV